MTMPLSQSLSALESESESGSEKKPESEPKPTTESMVKLERVRDHLPANDTRTAKEILASIGKKRNAFFVAKKDFILPLLPDKNLIQKLVEGGEYDDTEMHPYQPVESQPTG